MRDVTNPNAPTTNNAITVNRYRVTFRRSDGRNTPGVDVPYAFDGAVTFTVAPGDSVSVPFVLVRVQAKLEAPLAHAARARRRRVVISTIADVTFYGHDQTGREVSVTGTDQRQLRRLGATRTSSARGHRDQTRLSCAG